MKKSNYISGIIALCLVLIATIFKINHLPGASILLIVGLGSMALVFLPMVYLQLLKSTNDKLLKLVYHMAFISFFVDFIGMIFKVNHFSGAAILLYIGLPLPFIAFLPAYMYYHNRRKLKTDMSFSGILLFMIYLGVFSSFLALSVSRTVLNSSAEITNTINSGNKNATVLQHDQACADIIRQIEKIKSNLMVSIDNRNQYLITNNSIGNFEQLIGKDRRINYALLCQSGLNDFDKKYNSFKSKISKIQHPSFIDELFAEIEHYTIPTGNHEVPEISSLLLIDALNVLTDCQNKILLIDYLTGKKLES